MGTIHAKIKLDNPKHANLKPIELNALVDTGSLFLCLPEEVRLQLQLEATSEKEVTTADGKRCLCPYVGPVRVQFENRECYVGAVVLGDEVLLGADGRHGFGGCSLRSQAGCEPLASELCRWTGTIIFHDRRFTKTHSSRAGRSTKHG